MARVRWSEVVAMSEQRTLPGIPAAPSYDVVKDEPLAPSYAIRYHIRSFHFHDAAAGTATDLRNNEEHAYHVIMRDRHAMRVLDLKRLWPNEARMEMAAYYGDTSPPRDMN